MADKSTLTHDELRDDIRAGLIEAESRAVGLIRRKIKLAHALLRLAEEELHAGDDLVALSPPDDKD